jgi:hypothetical protein
MLSNGGTLYDGIVAGVELAAVALILYGTVRLLQRRRPELRLTAPLIVAVTVRLGAVAVFAAVPSFAGARGPDEQGFLTRGHHLAGDPSALGSFPDALVNQVQTWTVAVQVWVFGDISDIPTRVVEVGIAVAAIALVAAAVHDVAGPRAAGLAAWLLAVEPSNVFFSGIIHKESAALLGEGMVLLGAVRMYQSRDVPAGALLAAGVGLTALVRPYVGVAFGAAAVLVTCHAALRQLGPSPRRATVAIGAAAVGVVLAIALLPSPSRALDGLQRSQDANASDASNLRLARVDVSTPPALAVALPRRSFDLLARPYPWQVANLSQRLGVIGTVTAWLLLLLVILLVARRPRDAFTRLAPFFYVLIAVVGAYALSTGNAGTGFRYRTHVLMVLIGVGCALLPERVLQPSWVPAGLRVRSARAP